MKEYSLAANAILPVLDAFVNQNVPAVFGYQEKALAAMPAVATACGKAAVDAIIAAGQPAPHSVVVGGTS